MKIRKFYPSQVLRSISGSNILNLDEGQQHALQYFIRNSRRFNQAISVLDGVIHAGFGKLADSVLGGEIPTGFEKLSLPTDAVSAVFANANTRIFLKVPS